MRALCTVSAPLIEACAPPAKQLSANSRYLALKFLGIPQPHTLYFLVEAKSRVREVYTQTCAHFSKQGMLDTDLFGIAVLIDGEYLFAEPDSKLSKYGPKSWRSSHTHGLDANGRPLLEFHFRVQFYIESPLVLRDEISRHNYYLQLKLNAISRDVLKDCTEQSLILLGGLALQADVGDCPNGITKNSTVITSSSTSSTLASSSSSASSTTSSSIKPTICGGGGGGATAAITTTPTNSSTTTTTSITTNANTVIDPSPSTSTSTAAKQLSAAGKSTCSKSTVDYFRLEDYMPPSMRSSWCTTALQACHKQYRGMSRANAETVYIREACALHEAINAHVFRMRLNKNETGMGSIWFIVYAKGIKVFGENFQAITFLWPTITKLSFERKRFEIRNGDANKVILYATSDYKNQILFALCKDTHQFSMKISARLSEAIRREEEESNLHPCYMYSRSLNLPYKNNKNDQRISVISTTSSNTTSGIISDRVHSEDELEIMINSPPAIPIAAPSTESLAFAHLLDKPSVSRQTSSAGGVSLKELNVSMNNVSIQANIGRSVSDASTPDQQPHRLTQQTIIHQQQQQQNQQHSPQPKLSQSPKELLQLNTNELSDSPNSQHNIGSQCSSTCSTVVIATDTISLPTLSPRSINSSNHRRHRRPSTSSSLELGFSHTAQNSVISDGVTSMNLDYDNCNRNDMNEDHNNNNDNNNNNNNIIENHLNENINTNMNTSDIINDNRIDDNNQCCRENIINDNNDIGRHQNDNENNDSDDDEDDVDHQVDEDDDVHDDNEEEEEEDDDDNPGNHMDGTCEVYTLVHPAPTETSGVYTMSNSMLTGVSSELAESESHESSYYGSFQPKSEADLNETLDSVDGGYRNKRITNHDCNNDYRLRSDSNVSTSGSFRGDGSDPTDKKQTFLSADELSDLIVGRGTYPSRKTTSDTMDSDCDYVTLPMPLEGDSYLQGHQDTAPTEDSFEDDLLPSNPPAPPIRIDSNTAFTNMIDGPNTLPPPPYHGHHETINARGTITKTILDASLMPPQLHTLRDPPPYPQHLSRPKAIALPIQPTVIATPTAATTVLAHQQEEATARLITTKPQINILQAHASIIGDTTKPSYSAPTVNNTVSTIANIVHKTTPMLSHNQYRHRHHHHHHQLRSQNLHLHHQQQHPQQPQQQQTQQQHQHQQPHLHYQQQRQQQQQRQHHYHSYKQQHLPPPIPQHQQQPQSQQQQQQPLHIANNQSTIGIPIVPYSLHSSHKSMTTLMSTPPPPPYPDLKQSPRTCVLLPVIKPRQYIPPPPPSLPRQPPPPPPPSQTPPQISSMYSSQLARSQIELYQQQLYSDVDYVIYPIRDPAISQQEYLDAKQGSILAAMAQSPPPPPYLAYHTGGHNITTGTWDACKGHAIYRSTPYLSMAYSTNSRYASTQNLSDSYVQVPGALSPLFSPSVASLCSSYEPPPPPPLRPRPSPPIITNNHPSAAIITNNGRTLSTAITTYPFSRSKSDDNILNSIETLPKTRRLPPPPPPYNYRKPTKPPIPEPPIQRSPSTTIKPPMPSPPSLTITQQHASTASATGGSSTTSSSSTASISSAMHQLQHQQKSLNITNTNSKNLSPSSPPLPPSTSPSTQPQNTLIDINTLREKSKHLDLPLISALCNDRSLIKQTKAFVMPKHPKTNQNQQQPIQQQQQQPQQNPQPQQKQVQQMNGNGHAFLLSSSPSPNKVKYPVSGLSTNELSKPRKISASHRHPNDKLPPLPIMQTTEGNNYVMDPTPTNVKHKNFNSTST